MVNKSRYHGQLPRKILVNLFVEIVNKTKCDQKSVTMHTRDFLVTLNECDSSDQAVSVVVVVVDVNFFSFSTSSLKPLHGFDSNFVWMFLGWTPTRFFFKSGCYSPI